MLTRLASRILLTVVAVSAVAFGAYAVSGAAAGPAGGPQFFVDADDPSCTDLPAEGAGDPGSPFCSIQSAIDVLDADASSGGQLTLRAAEYDEGTITIDHAGLVIRGDPAVLRSAIIVHPDGNGDTGFHITDPFQVCDNITIQHLTLSGLSAQTTGRGILVDDVCDNHTFADLDIRDWGAQGILLNDSTAGPIGDGPANASDNVTINASAIRDNGGSGIELHDGNGNAVTGTEVTGNGSDGLTAFRETGLLVQGAALSGNGRFGLWAQQGNDTTVDGSSLSGNAASGFVAVGPHAGLELTDGTFNANGGAGIEFRLDVFSRGGDDTTIEDNEIAQNDGPGITSERHNQLQIRNNDITGNGNGISLIDDITVTVDANTVSGNAGSGIDAESQTSLRITGNAVNGNGLHGVELNHDEATVTGNDLDGNAASGLSARDLTRPLFADNSIAGSGGVGVDLRNNRDATLQGNEIASGASDGLLAMNELGLAVTGNEFRDNARTAVRISGGDQNEIAGNSVVDNGSAGTPADYGISAFEETDLTIEKNTMMRNLDGEIVVDASDDVVLRKNDLLTAADGIILRAGSSHAFGVVIGGIPGEGNRFRGLLPATNVCESPGDACYVEVAHTILPTQTFDARYNDWGTTSLSEIERVVCHDGEAGDSGVCGQNVLDFANPAPPSNDSPVDKPPTPTPTPVPGDPGDVNCDGLVTSIDALLILQYIAGLSGQPPCLGAADVDLDGDIDAIDATLILQYVAGLIGELPP